MRIVGRDISKTNLERFGFFRSQNYEKCPSRKPNEMGIFLHRPVKFFGAERRIPLVGKNQKSQCGAERRSPWIQGRGASLCAAKDYWATKGIRRYAPRLDVTPFPKTEHPFANSISSKIFSRKIQSIAKKHLFPKSKIQIKPCQFSKINFLDLKIYQR